MEAALGFAGYKYSWVFSMFVGEEFLDPVSVASKQEAGYVKDEVPGSTQR